jgi:drug/metabolite transporter (DMT)-like permease
MFVVILAKGPSLLKIRFRDIWLFLGTGICSFLFFNICYMTAINEASLSVAGILLYTSPFWVLLLSAPIFGERITVVQLIAITICFGGSGLLVFGAHLPWTAKGLIFGLLAGFGYALYSIFGKLAVRRYHSFTITFYTFLFAFLGTLPICNPTKLVELLTVPHNVWYSLAIAVVNTVLPYVLYTYGLKRVNAGKAAVIAIVEPVAAAVVGHIFFNEYITTIGIIGIVAVFLGLILLENAKER